MITSPAGAALQEQLRELFAALRELDKHQPHEVSHLLGTTITTIRSWKPQALLVAPTEGTPK